MMADFWSTFKGNRAAGGPISCKSRPSKEKDMSRQIDLLRKTGQPPPDFLKRFNRIRFNGLFPVNSTQAADSAKKRRRSERPETLRSAPNQRLRPSSPGGNLRGQCMNMAV
jgi:hypothetical protein